MPVIVPSVSSRFPRFDCALDGLDSLVPNSLPYLSRSHPSLLFTVRSSIPSLTKIPHVRESRTWSSLAHDLYDPRSCSFYHSIHGSERTENIFIEMSGWTDKIM